MTRIRPFLTLPFLALVATAAMGQQDAGSHSRIGDWNRGGIGPGRATEMAEQLRAAGINPPVQNVEPETIQKLLRMLEQNPDVLKRALEQNQNLRDQVGRISPDNPELNKQLQERSQAERQKMMENLQKAQRDIANRPQAPDAGGQPPSIADRPQPGSVGAGGSGQTSPPGNSPRLPETDANGDPQSPADQVQSERIREWARRLDRNLPESMKNSDAVRRFADRFRQTDFSKATGNKNILPERFRPNLDLTNRARGTGNFLERNLPRIGNRRTPSMPNVRAPNMPQGPSLPTMGAPGAPSAGEVGGTFTVLMIVGGILVGGFLIWKLLVQPMKIAKEKPKGWDPGSWPVNPTQIRTREELIKAFDHLALLNAGRPARHWHHMEIADHLGQPDQVRRVTANRLAQVYEHARYAPLEEPLPETQIALARNDIASLAGANPP